MEKDPEWLLAGPGSVRLEMAAVDCGLIENLEERPFAGPHQVSREIFSTGPILKSIEPFLKQRQTTTKRGIHQGTRRTAKGHEGVEVVRDGIAR